MKKNPSFEIGKVGEMIGKTTSNGKYITTHKCTKKERAK
jgi:hypothetical protein